MSRIRSVQTAHLGVDAIEDGVLRLTGGQQRAVLEVGSVNFGLKREIEQEAIVASYAAFLNSLSYRSRSWSASSASTSRPISSILNGGFPTPARIGSPSWVVTTGAANRRFSSSTSTQARQ